MIISKHSWTGNQVERHININFMPEKGAMKRYDYTNIARPE